MDALAEIEKRIGPLRLIGWQCAADGKWDAALAFALEDEPCQNAARLQQWLTRQTTENIACEAMFALPDGAPCFFGVRLTHVPKPQKRDILGEFLARGKAGDTLVVAAEKIRAILKEQHLAATVPDYLELGVFALWNRVKSVIVWEPGKTLLSPDEIARQAPRPDAGFAPLDRPSRSP